MARNDDSTISPTPGVGLTVREFVAQIERNVYVKLRVGMPAKVLRWRGPIASGAKSKPAMVDVQPEFIFSLSINGPNELTAEEKASGWTLLQEAGGWLKQKPIPEITNVPVHYSGQADMMVRGPIAVGEVGWLKFADRSIDKWIQSGGPIDPGFRQYHELTDAIFEPGLRYGKVAKPIADGRVTVGPEDDSAGFDYFTEPSASAAPGDIALRTSGSTATVDAATEIKIGLAATLAAIRTGDPVNPGVNMATWALAVETAINAILPGTFTPLNSFATTVAVPANSGRFGTCGTGSAKVKIE